MGAATMKAKHHFVLTALAGAMLALASTTVAAEETESIGAKPVERGSIESIIERRRERLDRLRDRRRDLYTGRRWRQSPWENANDDWMDQREELMNEQFRRRRDAAEARRDALGRWRNPWSQWREDHRDARRNARELDRLYWEERHEHPAYRPRYGIPWRGHYWGY
jgi:hypothetical protein